MTKKSKKEFDPDDVLRDGESLHVPLTMMDVVRGGIVEERRRARMPRVLDGSGGIVDLRSGSRPGFRLLNDSDGRLHRELAYEDYREALCDGWKQETSAQESEPPLAGSVFAKDDRQRAYQEYDAALRDAWRGTK